MKQVFAVAGSFVELQGIFEAGDTRTLGDFARRLPDNSYDHVKVSLDESEGQASDWRVAAEPRTKWLHASVSELGDEVKVVIDRSGFSKREDLCLGIIVLTESAEEGGYYGMLIETVDIEPSGFWIFKSGPAIRVALRGDAPPVRTSQN